MKSVTLLTLTAAMSLTAAGGLQAASITYGGVEITRGSDVDMRYAEALDRCSNEAAIPPRGIPRTDNFYNRTALRACLYRNGFSETGDIAYPVPLFGSPSRRY